MDKVIEAVRQLLNSTVADSSSPLYLNTSSPAATPYGIRSVYWGDPVKIPESNFPALIVHPLRTRPLRRGSRYDQKTHQFDIRLVYNGKSYMNQQADDPNKVFSLEDAIQKTEETDSSFGTKKVAIVGVVQANPTLAYGSVAKVCDDAQWIETNYVFNSARGFPSFEVISTFEATVIGDRGTP